MKMLTMVIKGSGRAILPLLIAALALALVTATVSAQNNTSPSVAEMEAMTNYQEAKAEGRNAEAVKYLLDYIEKDQGENAPMTISLLQRYGNLLRDEGNIREAIDVLKEARQRGIDVYGEHGLELFELNMDLGNAYIDRDIGVGRPRQYFDDALEVLRENGQQNTILYVNALVATASGLTQAGALEGLFSAGTRGEGLEDMIDTGLAGVTYGYNSGYGVLGSYLEEASELAESLGNEDPYLGPKIAIVEAKIRVLATIYQEAVTPNIRGSITDDKAREYYLQEDERLASSFEILNRDPGLNREYLEIASHARMDIAWLNEDMEMMANFCNDDSLDMKDRYPPDRLFEIADDGSVIAPRFSFNIPGNIFGQLKTNVIDSRMNVRRVNNWGPNRKPGLEPAFVPVCINGRLMAALINAPRVEIEDIE